MANQADHRPGRAISPEGARMRASLSFGDLLLQLWRAKWLMLLAASFVFAFGLLVTWQTPVLYKSAARLYVHTGADIDVRPVILAELEFLQSSTVAERTVSRFPLHRVSPGLAAARDRTLASTLGSASAIEDKFFWDALAVFKHNFSSAAEPGSPVIRVSYTHGDPGTAVELLNAALAAYLDYRTEVTQTDSTPAETITDRRKQLELDLLSSEDAIRDFLNTHELGDFEHERAAAQAVSSTLLSELSAVRARISAIDGQLATTRSQMADTPVLIEQPIDIMAQQVLVGLKAERAQLLARYTENSQAVRAIDQQITQVETQIAAENDPAIAARTAPNPIYQALEADQNSAQAGAQSLSRQRANLTAQLARVEAQLQLFSKLEPAWNDVVRKRDVLDASVREMAAREQQTVGPDQKVDGVSIRLLEPASVPSQPVNQRLPAILLTLLFAALSALLVGLVRSFTRPGFATRRSFERMTGLQVVETVRRYK